MTFLLPPGIKGLESMTQDILLSLSLYFSLKGSMCDDELRTQDLGFFHEKYVLTWDQKLC